MEHCLTISSLGPIDHCEIILRDLVIINGPQSNGKSTIAKAIFYFRSIKQDILSIMMQGGPQNATGNPNAKWEGTIRSRMREKFLQLFGTSWIMPPDMNMEYTYGKNVSIRVFLRSDSINPEKNYVDFQFSEKISDYLLDLESHSFTNMLFAQKEHELRLLEALFNDKYETVFIPAGRNLITLLSSQLNYIFTSLEGSQLRNIDYITKKYTEQILKLKPFFQDGMDSVWSEARTDAEQSTKVKRISPCINLFLKEAQKILKGTYKYIDGEERLYLDSRKYVKINLASSGQQEVVWILNLLFYYLFEEQRVFLILEEPESHLYPESQRLITQILCLFANAGNQLLITTHSPYVLGALNYLLIPHQSSPSGQKEIAKSIHKRFWIEHQKATAWFIQNGHLENILSNEDGISLIKNEMIDGASQEINSLTDICLSQMVWEEI